MFLDINSTVVDLVTPIKSIPAVKLYGCRLVSKWNNKDIINDGSSYPDGIIPVTVVETNDRWSKIRLDFVSAGLAIDGVVDKDLAGYYTFIFYTNDGTEFDPYTEYDRFLIKIDNDWNEDSASKDTEYISDNDTNEQYVYYRTN